MTDSNTRLYQPTERLLMIVGNYGSGKTEVAVNLAVQLAQQGKRVHLADLDIVNPYFRSREARATMEHHGIRVVVPPGAQQYADLPIVLPEIKGMLEPTDDDISIFDVGGDDVGAKMLSSFHEALGATPYSLLQVINSRRPFTDSVAGCLKMQQSIEFASRMKVTGAISNSHLIEDTTIDVILEGYELGRDFAAQAGIPVAFVTAMGELADDPALAELDASLLRLERVMLPPWLQREEKHDSSIGNSSELAAGRVKPIGKP